MELLNYWPGYLQEITELQELAAAEQPEFTSAAQQIRTAPDDFFLFTLSKAGVERWESIMQITPEQGASIDSRRDAILMKYLNQLPFTLRWLQQKLALVFGSDDFRVSVDYPDYTLLVEADSIYENAILGIYHDIRATIPSNMILMVSVSEAQDMAQYCGFVLHTCDEIYL